MAPFEFALTCAADRSQAAMVRDVVAHGARQAGSAEDAALNFGLMVEDAVRGLVGEVVSDARLGVLLRHEEGPLQVTITLGAETRSFALDV